jgi:hypothetical protein
LKSKTFFGVLSVVLYRHFVSVVYGPLQYSRIQHNSAAVDTWEAALKLLDKYPWFKLHPIRVHPEFRSKLG